MAVETDIPEADCAAGALHPRFSRHLIGRDRQQQTFLTAVREDRLHHAWLISGPRGIGKATLAWKIARFLLSQPVLGHDLLGPPTDLDSDPDAPVAHRIDALAEQGLYLLRRPWDPKTKKLRAFITVDEVRALKRFFHLSLTESGRRVVIVDCADEMNTAAANALLKLLEEPPPQTVFLIVCHMPSRLLPTVRSRCRTLPCLPLTEDEVVEILTGIDDTLDHDTAEALARLSDGSVGVALWLHQHNGPALMNEVQALFATMPAVDRMRALALATSLAQRDAADRCELFLQLFDAFLADLARAGVLAQSGGSPRADLLRRLSPTPAAGRHWAEARQEMTARVRNGLAVNLDPHSLILDMIFRVDALAGQCAAS
ncbi:DNA polymerase III subunit delta' [Pseudoruegeria sp. SK021]|uniref:DNA polymerase III subunit delta' n=1 Tax=Pseudoruegeria sp. SK021 TaxID=1933035 RepID=UPI000A24BD8D|nr:DNA polymerase III subunit delta' [Pseudoruegeria sp. SK021]OSP56652.1 hypothetical protein BV911_01465 [Pseudoruegeria sp. SK021]